jgi:hypothetical protein
MSTLTWLIYLISIVNTIGILTAAALSLLCLVGFLGLIALVVLIDDTHDDEERRELKADARYYARWFTTLATIFVLILVFIPDRQTMLLMAGAEIGKRMEVGDKVLSPGIDLLKAWIENETVKLRKEKSE